MKIAILKDKKVTSILDLQQYIIEAIVAAHGGDSWIEVPEDNLSYQNLKEGDLILSDRETDTLSIHMKG